MGAQNWHFKTFGHLIFMIIYIQTCNNCLYLLRSGMSFMDMQYFGNYSGNLFEIGILKNSPQLKFGCPDL